jgi:hypothetical protein
MEKRVGLLAFGVKRIVNIVSKPKKTKVFFLLPIQSYTVHLHPYFDSVAAVTFWFTGFFSKKQYFTFFYFGFFLFFSVFFCFFPILYFSQTRL